MDQLQEESSTHWDARAPIYLIESPSARDLYSGRNEGHSLVSILSLGEVEVNYFITSDAEHFEIALVDIAKLISERDDFDYVMPFLHISAHGAKDGIELTDGDVILWDRLTKLLRDLHVTVGCSKAGQPEEELPKCSLSLSSCSAFSNYVSTLSDNLPVQTILGPDKDVGWCQSLLAFSSFYYQAFVQNQTFKNAVSAMNAAACGPEAATFQLYFPNGLEGTSRTGGSRALAVRFSGEDLGGEVNISDRDVPHLRNPSPYAR